MLVWTDVSTDSRVLREATALVAAGHEVHVVCREVPASYVPPEGVAVTGVRATSTLKAAAGTTTRRRMSAPVRAARWLLLPTHVAQAHRRWVAGARAAAAGLDFDVVHAHDLTALELGAELARGRGVPLVYDSHEYWSGRDRSGRPTPLQHARERALERRLGGEAAAVVTVGDGLADALRADYGWADVTVVRNTFPRADAAPPGPPATEPAAVVYAGRIGPGRDLETVVSAARALAPFPVTLVGPADEAYAAGLDAGPVRVLPALPLGEVDRLLRETGLALVTLTDGPANHRLAMPNKLFHAVHAGVPVVASDIGELAATVRRYGVGTLYRPGDAGSLAAAVAEARRRYPALVAAVRAAADELSWEHDARRLVDVYAALADQRALRGGP
jgi:glycogen synthase